MQSSRTANSKRETTGNVEAMSIPHAAMRKKRRFEGKIKNGVLLAGTKIYQPLLNSILVKG